MKSYLNFSRFLFVHKIPLSQNVGFVLLIVGIEILVSYVLEHSIKTLEVFLLGLIFAVVGIFMSIPPLLTQYHSVKSILKDGIEVSGKIVDLYFSFGQGYVTYEYVYHGKKYRASNNINRTRGTKKLQIEQNVTLRLNRNDLNQAYSPEIYM